MTSNRRVDPRLVLLACLVLAAFAVGGASAQDEVGLVPHPCLDAAVWHLHQAMQFSLAVDQDWHRGAAAAAVDLDGLGDSCDGWQDDASRPGPDGDGSADGADALQAARSI